MKKTTSPNDAFGKTNQGGWIFLIAIILCCAVYSAGLTGGFLFDDYPNIVDNKNVQPLSGSIPSLVGAALSSPSSEFKRPLASLSFAANYLLTGLDPYWMKFTNLAIHVLNGLMIYLLAKSLLEVPLPENLSEKPSIGLWRSNRIVNPDKINSFQNQIPYPVEDERQKAISHKGTIAALIAGSWMLLPINLTAVLYVVQRMESIANLFVLIGLIGYVSGRRRMFGEASSSSQLKGALGAFRWNPIRGFILCFVSVTVPSVIGVLAKETAVMLPLYALIVEWIIFRFLLPIKREEIKGKPVKMTHFFFKNKKNNQFGSENFSLTIQKNIGALIDWRIFFLFFIVLVVPLIIGAITILPSLLNPFTWATRDFTLSTRLMSESRIVSDYIFWTILPNFDALSFYHDDFFVSTNLLTPWTTLTSILFLTGLLWVMFWMRHRLPLASLGIALFFACHLLTGTVIPLELIYEHRNYFASFGLMLTVIPLLAVQRSSSFALSRHVLLGGLLVSWSILTLATAYAWGSPLRLAEDLASRAPLSPRAQYELGRTYIIYSHYDPTSPFTTLAYSPLEKSAALPDSSILPEQALIFMNSRMKLPLKNFWWDSLISKLKNRKPTVQDESSLGALTQCMREGHCDLPKQRMLQAFVAALSHPDPSARLLAMYGDFAWNILDDHRLGELMTDDAVKSAPRESAYRITLVRMLAAQGRTKDAHTALEHLQALDVGGSLDSSVNELRALPGM